MVLWSVDLTWGRERAAGKGAKYFEGEQAHGCWAGTPFRKRGAKRALSIPARAPWKASTGRRRVVLISPLTWPWALVEKGP